MIPDGTFSSMAHAAVPKLLKSVGADVIRGDQFLSALELIGAGLPIAFVNLFRRAQKLLRCFVAVQAPAHVKRVSLPGDGHLVDLSVTGGAADSFLNVDAVIEKYEIGSLVDSLPHDGLAGGEALAYRSEHGRILPYL